MLLALSAIIARLWWIQVARGEEYTNRIRGSSQVTVRIPSVRGEIKDRSGLTMVRNRPSWEVDFYLPDMVKGYRRKYGEVPMTTYRGVYGGMVQDRREADVVKIVNETVVQRLAELNLAKPFNGGRLQTHYRNDREVPFTYIEDLDFATMAKFAENDVGLPGMDLAVKPVREYVYGAMAAHLLGYVGPPVHISEEPDAGQYNFYQADIQGKSQIEFYMNDVLRGKPGVRVMQRNAKGVIEGVARVEPPTPGNDVYLTIDARIQMIAENAMRSVGRGAAVVVDPWSGDILAMVSVPSYDPNTFIPSISLADWNVLREDETDPLTNRAISGYAPGSTYKVPIALAGLRKGIGPYARFTCSGGVTYGRTYMRCWIASKNGSHGSLDLLSALKVSCNAFFYQYGNAAGEEAIVAAGNLLGLGQKSGIELSGESPGILPGKEWLAQNHPRERWSSGFTANTAIGQGYVLTSPLQMAMVTATVANGGMSYYPRLIDRVMTPDGALLERPPARLRANLLEQGLTPEAIETVRRGMWKVVNENGGTARRARIAGMEVAGKTGTAQFKRGGKKDNHTWFIAFAPYEQPKYAICVFVQGAEAGGAVSAPIAAKILEDAFKLEDPEAERLQVAKLEPAVGSFQHIQEIDFGRPIPAALRSTDEETSETVAANSMEPQVQRVTASPNIKPEADERGRVIPRAQPVEASEGDKKPNLFQRIFRKRNRGGGE